MVIFSELTALCNHHHQYHSRTFLPRKKLCWFAITSVSTPSLKATEAFFLPLCIGFSLDIRVNRILQYRRLHVSRIWILSLHITVLRFTHDVAWITILSLFISVPIPLYGYATLYLSQVHEHRGIRNNVAMDICMNVLV